SVAPRLELRQSQALVMTPQLQQAIKLLQMSNLELTAYVEQELEQNPLLERDEGEPEAYADVGGEAAETGGSESENVAAIEISPDGSQSERNDAPDHDEGDLWDA